MDGIFEYYVYGTGECDLIYMIVVTVGNCCDFAIWRKISSNSWFHENQFLNWVYIFYNQLLWKLISDFIIDLIDFHACNVLVRMESAEIVGNQWDPAEILGHS